MGRWKEATVAAFVFATTAAFFAWLAGNRLVLINDEGIYLDGAVDILRGLVPYRDFFALTGPGSFWNLALLFRLFGVSLATGRMLLVTDLALITACMYWLVATLHSRSLALWLCGCYVALLAADTGTLVVNHRWDSTAAAVLGVATLIHGLRTGRWWVFAVSGAASAYAAWITPPVVLIPGVLFGWIILRKRSAEIAAFLAGLGTVTVAAIALLLWTSSLWPLVRALLWTTSQYSSANHFAYGAIIGGYASLFSDATGFDWLVRAVLVFFVALPAILPLFTAPFCLASPRFRQGPELLLLISGAAAIAGCYPRLDVGHLVYAVPLWYVLAATAIAGRLRRAGPHGQRWLPSLATTLLLACSLVAGVFGANAVVQRVTLSGARGRIGNLVADPRDLSLVQDLQQSVRSGESFFAFPYLPLAYFLTGGRNPTRYSFLQPGMMSVADEQAALDELKREPPSKALYMNVPVSAYLRLFPSSDPARLRMVSMEAYLEQCYARDAGFSRAHPGYELLLRHPSGCSPAPNK